MSTASGDLMADYALLPDRVWDGQADEARAGQAVVVRDGTIASLCAPAQVPADVERVGLAGCTLLPGLLDLHVHYSAAMGPAFLAAGVTTIRDVGNDLAWILAQRSRHAAQPAAGPAIHCCGHLLDGDPASWPRMGRAHGSPAALRASVGEHVAAGVDAIKLYAGLDLAMLGAGIEAAHGAGLFVVAHLGGVTAEEAARAGLDELEHLAGCGPAWREATAAEDDAAIDALLEHDVVIDPTLVVWDRLGRILDRPFHHDARRRWVHPCHLDIWNRYRSRFGPPEDRLRLQRPVPHMKRFLRRAHERGVTVALGTDTPFPHLVPGASVQDELAMYVDAGLRPVDALRCATSVNAGILGAGNRIGAVAPGMQADLVAVRGNPLERIEDVGQVECAIRSGCRFSPAQLLAAARESFGVVPQDAVTQDLLEYVNRP